MPTPLDIKQQLDAAIWALLEANADFTATVKLGNRLKAYATAPAPVGPQRQRIQTAPNDYPQVRVEVGNVSRGQNAPKVFAMNSTSFSSTVCDVPVPATQQAIITVTYDKERANDQTPLEAIISAALHAKYPNLGIAGASDLTIQETRSPRNAPKPFVRMVVSIVRHMKLSQLV